MSISQNFPNIRPTLNLDFANTKVLDPRITYTRASTGTYFGADGVIKTAIANQARFDHDPLTEESLGLLVEEARTNSQTYSNNFATNWTLGGGGTGALYPNAFLAPDGTFTASKLACASNVYLASPNGYGGGNTGVTYNISTGTYVSTLVGSPTSHGATAVGNGWYRVFMTISGVTCSVYAKSAELSQITIQLYAGSFFIYSADGSVGNTTNGILIWAAQLETGSFPTSYIPTPSTFTGRSSTATYYDSAGVIQTAASGVARSDAYFPDSSGIMRSAGLLLEAAGTNLVTYSEQFDNAAWSNTVGANTSTISANSAVAPDGASTADKIVTTVNNALHGVQRLPHITVTSGTTYSVSVYAKAAGWSWIGIRAGSSALDLRCTVDLSTGAIVNNAAGIASVKSLPNSWYHVSIVGTATSTSFEFIIEAHNTAGVQTSETGDGTSGIFVWGAQLEASPYPTSYIPTSGSTVTRSADTSTSATVTRSADVANMTGVNFSSWYNQSQGTLFSRYTSLNKNQNIGIDVATIYGNSGYDPFIKLSQGYSSGFAEASVYQSGTYQAALQAAGTYYTGMPNRVAFAVKENNFAFAGNGGAVSTDTSGALPAAIRMNLFEYNTSNSSGIISRLTYYPQRLTDAQLQNLTK